MRAFYLAFTILFAAVLGSAPVLFAGLASAQPSDDLDALSEQVQQLYQARKYAEAILLAERYVALVRARHGEERTEFAAAISWLGIVYQGRGRLTEAEPLLKRALEIREKMLPGGHRDIAQSLENLGLLYGAQGRLADAAPLLKRGLDMREETLPPGHLLIAYSLTNLAAVYWDQGRPAEAEPLLKRALEIREKALSGGHSEVATSIFNLAFFYATQGRLTEAEPLYRRALEMREKVLSEGHPDIATTLNNLGLLYVWQVRPSDAEPLLKRALDTYEKTLPAGHSSIARGLTNLSAVYETQGRYAEAESLLKRALSIYEQRQNPSDVAESLSKLASIYWGQGRLAEAEAMYKRALEMREKALPEAHPDIAKSVNNLAIIYQAQGRLAEAEPLLQRSLEMNEKALPTGHPDVARGLNSLAFLYHAQGRLAEAQPKYQRALEMREKALPEGHLDIAQSLLGLAGLYQAQGRLAEAEPLYQRALAIHERTLPKGHPDTMSSLFNLATLYQAQSRLAEAEPLLKRSLEVSEKGLPEGSLQIYMSLGYLSALALARQDWPSALAYVRRATAILIKLGERETAGRPSAARGGIAENSNFFRLHVLAAHRSANQTDLREESFAMAQWAERTSAASALSQMAARQAKGEGALSSLVRELQDLEAQLRAADTLLSSALGQTDARQADEVRRRITNVEMRWQAIEGRLTSEFKEYAAFANPKPLSIVAAQALLRSDEALLVFLDVPEEMAGIPTETLLWVVTPTDARWVRAGLGTIALGESVAALRCGLDRAAWEGVGATRCRDLLKGTYSAVDARLGKPLPFDLVRAHELYQALFSQVEDHIKNKHLLVVPSGPLTALPFQVLVAQKAAAATMPANGTGYADVAWLAKRHAVTVLPSVHSLKALRQFAKASRATQPFIGFGNPLLLGPHGNDRRSWERQSCKTPTAPLQIASRGVRSAIPKFFRGGLANVEDIRAQYPLPETADELCAVAQSSGAPESVVYLGERATETTIKALSANGSLATARVVHFATHGLLAGETEKLAATKSEPALILTPPKTASEEDDGLLTASEISQLKLDADWVVLSACNTAAGESNKPGAETLSGLARAFFYAGGRALLVSHWAVNSQATVHLVTNTFDEIKADPRIGRAEALRRSMLTLVARGGEHAHPANWSPFVVVGEGAN